MDGMPQGGAWSNGGSSEDGSAARSNVGFAVMSGNSGGGRGGIGRCREIDWEDRQEAAQVRVCETPAPLPRLGPDAFFR